MRPKRNIKPFLTSSQTFSSLKKNTWMKVQEFQHRNNQKFPPHHGKTNQSSHTAMFILLITVIHFLFMLVIFYVAYRSCWQPLPTALTVNRQYRSGPESTNGHPLDQTCTLRGAGKRQLTRITGGLDSCHCTATSGHHKRSKVRRWAVQQLPATAGQGKCSAPQHPYRCTSDGQMVHTNRPPRFLPTHRTI